MVQVVRDAGSGIGVFEFPNVWPKTTNRLLAVFGEFYGPQSDAVDFAPHANEAALRQAIHEAAPELTDIATGMKSALANGCCALVAKQAWLAEFDIAIKRRLLYAISLALGTPTATDKINRRIIWDIRERTLAPGYIPTYSEHSDEAALHTDTQYYPEPEKYLLLYFVRPAACGGGVSTLLDGRALKDRLARTREGRLALEILQEQPAPFLIPRTFTTTAEEEAVEATFAPIFSKVPFIRYRKDTLARGFAAFPEYDTPELRGALDILHALVDDESQWFASNMPQDALLLADNHVALHGRTAFEDKERHAIRIRIA